MSDENQQNSGTTTRQPIQIKNRTVLVVLLFVIVPWVALALPGFHAGQHEVDENNVISASVHKKFGWPLTHKTESKTFVISQKRGGQLRTSDPVPPEKLDKLMAQHGELFQSSSDSGALNLVPRTREGQSFASIWTDQNSYPTEIRNYIQDNVLKGGLQEQWNIPMLIVNIVLLTLACLGVGYLVEKSSK